MGASALVMGMGYSLMSLDFHGLTGYEQVVDMVKTAVEEAEPGEWILGRGWHQSKWDKLLQEMRNLNINTVPAILKYYYKFSRSQYFNDHDIGHGN